MTSWETTKVVRWLALAALVLLPSLARAQFGQVTLIRSSPEPLPNCTPAVPGQPEPQIWDITAGTVKYCTATNTWTAASIPTLYYQTIDVGGTAATQQPAVNFINGTNMTISCVNNAGASRTDCTFTATSTAATAFSSLTPSSNSNAGTFAASGNTWDFSAATALKVPTVGLIFPGSSSGTTTFAPPATGTTTINIPAAGGTLAVSALGPITLSLAGQVGCATCNTSSASVSSVSITQTGSVFTITGSPVTSSGSINLAFASVAANEFLASPSGAPGAPATRVIVGADLPAINLAASGAGGVTGILPAANLPTTVVYNAQSNTYSTGTQSFASATALLVPGSAGYAPTVSGSLGYDTTAQRYVAGMNGTNVILPWFTTGTPVNGGCVTWIGTAGQQGETACGSGGGGGSGTVNAATQYALPYYSASGSATTLSGVASPTVNGVYSVAYNISGSAASAPIIALPGILVRANTATTDTILATDRVSLVTESNASPIAITGPASLASNMTFAQFNIGAGLATFTPSTGLVNGAATQAIPSQWFAFHYTNGTNAWMPVMPTLGAFPSCSAATSALIFTTATSTIGCNSFPFASGTLGQPAIYTATGTAIGSSPLYLDAKQFSTVQLAMTAAGASQPAWASTGGPSDVPLGTQINSINTPSSSSQTASTRLIDYRDGSVAYSYFNPNTQGLGNFAIAHGIIGNWTQVFSATPSNTYLVGVQQNVYDGGVNLNQDAYTNKSNYQSGNFGQNRYGQGQGIGLSGSVNGYGSGDAIGLACTGISWGGANAGSDEGAECLDANVSQGPVAYVGTITSGAATGATLLTLTPSAGAGTQGSGRYLIDTTQATSTGTVTTITGTGPVTYTLTGVSLATSTSTTSSTAVSAPGTATITVGSISGITANSTLVCVADGGSFETIVPTATSGTGPTLTATFRKPHTSGATYAWGGLCGSVIELTADRWTTTGAIGFVNVLNTLRQAWPIIASPTSSTLSVWISVAGAYNSYNGLAPVSTATNAYTIYPAAEVVSVQASGTFSNTFTLAPNNVAWATSDGIEEPIYPAAKVSFGNIQINRFFACSSASGCGGAGYTYNGRWGNNDNLFQINNTTAFTSYAGHGGSTFTPPLAFFNGVGLAKYGLDLNNLPDFAALNAGCPINTSGVSDCTGSSFSIYKIINVANNSGATSINIIPLTGQLNFNVSSCCNLITPLINGDVTANAADLSVSTGHVSCTQATCATSAATLATAPASNVLYRVDASVACTGSTSTATAILTISYTDVSSTAQTIVMPTATCTTLGASSVASLNQSFTPKGGTVVQYAMTNANTPLYQARVFVYQESVN